MQSICKSVQTSFLKQSLARCLTQTPSFLGHTFESKECEWRHNAYKHPLRARVTMAAPQFKGMAWTNGEFKQISLVDYMGKYVVLFFYPLDFTFVCPTEIKAFNDKAAEFSKIGA